MSPRTGRPKKDDAKRTFIGLRLDETETKILDDFCEALNVSRSEMIRKLIHEADAKNKNK